MYCQHCGKELPDEAAFCGYCGARLTPADGAEAAASAAQPVSPAQPATPTGPSRVRAPGGGRIGRRWWRSRRLWIPAGLILLALAVYLGWGSLAATPAGVMAKVAWNLRDARSVEFLLTESQSGVRVSGSWARSGGDWAALVRTRQVFDSETGFMEYVGGDFTYYRETDSSWEEDWAPLGFKTPERAQMVAGEFVEFFTDSRTRKRLEEDRSIPGVYVLKGKLPGDLVAYLKEAVAGGEEPKRLPPDGEFRLFVDRRSGHPTKVEVTVSEPEHRFNAVLELEAWNLAQVRVPSRLRSVIKWPF